MSKYNIGKFIATSLLGSSLALNGAMPGIVALADEAEPGQVAVDGSQSQTDAPEEGGSPSSDPETAVEAGSEEAPDVSDIPADSVETPEATPEQGDSDAVGTEGPVAEPGTDATAGEPAEGGSSDEAPAAPAEAGVPEAGGDAAVSAEGDAPAAAQTPDEAPAALSAAEALSFVYVEQPSVEASGTQNIAFILSDPAADVAGATLDVLCPDGTVRRFSSSAVSGAAVRFQIDASELGQGYVELSQLTVALADGSSRTVSLSSDGSLDYGFTVSGTYYSLFASEPQAQSDVSFYVASGDGIVEASSIEGALAQAQADTPSTYAASRSASSKIVVALDAGHDSSKHPGAGGNGLREEELTLKIAQYAKAELETYPGVEVYMVRSSGECPYPDAATEGEELQQRVEGAVAAGAHVYVSIHLNSYDSSSVSGAEVWYPNQSVNTTVADVGEELSQDILDQLTDLGLYDRGTKENESLGEGSDLDYYSVIRNSKLNGIPGIIVEHAFISSSADYGYLSTEEGLRALGVADATGIANYFGLTKDGSSEPVSAQGGVLELGRATSSSFQIVARNVVCSRGVEAVSVGISRVGSDEEARWYPLEKQQDGTWRATIPFSDFDGVAGEYALVGALSDSDWAGRVFCETTLEIDPASQPASVEASYDSSTGSLKAVASGGSLSRASNVAFAVAGANGSTVWYQGVRAQDGSWSASVPRSAHGTGACTVQVWATVGSQTSMLASASSSFPEVGAASGKLSVGAYDAASGTFEVAATGVSYGGGVQGVSVGVWYQADGAATQRWYALQRQSDGSWSARIPTSDFGDRSGTYAVQAALSDATWTARSFGGTATGTVTVAAPEVEASYDSSTGSLKAVASGGSLSRASNVAFAVAGANGSTVWYQGVRAQDGSWSASVPRSAHGTGACTVQVWATVGSQTSMLASASSSFPEVGAASGKLSVGAYDAASGTFEVAATGVSYGGGVQGVSVGVWYQADGAATQRWYALQRQSDGSWSARIPTSDFGDRSGTYAVQAALSDATWTARSFGGTATGTVTVAAPEVEASYDSSTGSLKAVASGGSLSRASNVAFAVAGANGSTVWYQGVRAQDGSWSASVPRSAHGTGACTVQVWATVGSQTSMLASASSSFPAPEEPIEGTASVALSDDSASFVLTAEGGSFPDAWNVSFAVADLATGSERWVQAYRAADGSWSAEVPVSSCNGNEQRVGAWAAVGDKTVELGSATFSSRLHPIMNDESDVDPATLAEAFADAGGIYPADTYKTKGAATAEEFFTILVEEAEAEGVDPLAVYAQLVYETGYLRFGGDVKAEQCNFCGLGATGAGAGGATFPSVRAGIRAQVQHLKAYASTEDLVNECVDPRFEHVDRGCAPYLESLGGRWAVSSSYGFGLSIIVDSLA